MIRANVGDCVYAVPGDRKTGKTKYRSFVIEWPELEAWLCEHNPPDGIATPLKVERWVDSVDVDD